MKPGRTWWRWWRIDGVGLGTCAALTLVLYLGAFWPLMRNHAECVAQQSLLAREREQTAQLDAEAAALRTRLETARQTLARSPLRLQPASNVNRQLTRLSALAEEAGLEVVDIRPDNDQPGAHYDIVPIVLAGRGTYPACTAFLSRLRKTLPDTGASALELRANWVEQGAPPRFRFDLQWYAAPTLLAARSPEQAVPHAETPAGGGER